MRQESAFEVRGSRGCRLQRSRAVRGDRYDQRKCREYGQRCAQAERTCQLSDQRRATDKARPTER